MTRSTVALLVAYSVHLYSTSAALAQHGQFEGRRIVAVEYSPAEQSVMAEELTAMNPVKVGAAYRAEDIAAAIDRLFATGRYKDIRVEGEPSGEGVLVRFVMTERWFIGGVSITGKVKNPPTRGQLIDVTNLTLGGPFAEGNLTAAEANLRRLFESNGLYQAQIEPMLRHDERGRQIHFTFHVHSGKRARYTQPLIKGDPKLAENALIKATGSRYAIIGVYKPVTANRTRRMIASLHKKYQSQDRLMAKVTIEGLEYDEKTRRVRPVLNIDAGPKVEVRTLETKVSKRILHKQVPIYEEHHVDRDLLVEGARNLRDYFQARGYYDVDVDFRIIDEAPDQRAIEYVIARGPRHKVSKVVIEGNKYFDSETIRERMFVIPATFLLRHGRYSEAMRKKDEENIANLYRANGFRDVKVTSLVVRNGKPQNMVVTLRIDEGPQWFVDNIEVKGVSQLDRDELTSRFASIPGQPFSEVNIAADRNTSLTEYYTKGFSDATFRWESTPAGAPYHVNLKYEVNEGKRRYVRDVLLTGITTTRPSMVENAMSLESGDALSPPAMLDSQKKLYDTGNFARVNTAIQNPDGDTERKFVLYDIEEASRYNLRIGFGAELARFGGTAQTLDTPAGSNGFSPRVSAEVSRMNFLGLGHVVSLRTRISNLQQRASFNYMAPRFRNIDGRNISFTLLHDNARDVRTFASRRQEASVQLSQQFSKALTGLFRVTYRRVTTSDVIIPTLLVPALLQPVRIGIISMNLAQDRRNDPTDTRYGIFNTVDFGLASNAFGSQRSFLRALGRNATYHRITRNVVFARQTTVGLLFPFAIPQGLTRTEAVPLPERFFGGGSTSHRGFGDNQAGPRDIGVPIGPGGVPTQPTGFPVGGNALLFNNLELRFPLLGANLRGVLFHDSGNAFSNISNISFRQRQRNLQDFDYMVHAVGIGIRYKTPVGPIRGDIAYSINPPSFVGFKGNVQELLACNPNVPAAQLPSACRGVQQSTGHLQFFFSIGQTF